MEYSQDEAGFLQELVKFIGVRTTFFGLVAIFSAFLPLLNETSQVLPVEAVGVNDGVFDIISPFFITVISTFMTFLAVVTIFSTRGSYRGRGKRDAGKKALISLRITLIALISYIALYQLYSKPPNIIFHITLIGLQKLYFEVPLLLAYATFFSHLTQTLMLVAMTKFYKDKNPQPLLPPNISNSKPFEDINSWEEEIWKSGGNR